MLPHALSHASATPPSAGAPLQSVLVKGVNLMTA